MANIDNLENMTYQVSQEESQGPRSMDNSYRQRIQGDLYVGEFSRSLVMVVVPLSSYLQPGQVFCAQGETLARIKQSRCRFRAKLSQNGNFQDSGQKLIKKSGEEIKHMRKSIKALAKESSLQEHWILILISSTRNIAAQLLGLE